MDLCYGFLRKAQAHLAERETEFSELIAVLSEMVATLGGGATFDDQLDRSTERLHKIVDINDIRILKRRLTVEIEALKRSNPLLARFAPRDWDERLISRDKTKRSRYNSRVPGPRGPPGFDCKTHR